MQVIGSRGPGGAEAFYLRLVNALSRDCAILPVVRRNSWLADQLTADGFTYEVAPFGGQLDFRTKGVIKTAEASFRPDVIQYWMNRAARFAPRFEEAVSVGRLGGYYNLKYYRAMDYLVGNTKDIVDYVVAQGWPEDRAAYIPNFAEAPSPDFKSDRDAIRARLQIPDDGFVLLAAGRLHENKGLDVLMAAFAQLPGSVHLLLAGEGPLEKSLRITVERDGLAERVHFLGWVRPLSPLCAASDLWVVPSRHEPLGNVVLEAWMHGLPVVATRSKGPESLIRHGETGVLVALEDAAALALAVRALMDDQARRETIAQRGKDEGEAGFSAEAVTARYLDFYRRIIAERHKTCAA